MKRQRRAKYPVSVQSKKENGQKRPYFAFKYENEFTRKEEENGTEARKTASA